MSTPRRPVRLFRPLTDALEGRAAVSSLIVGLPSAAPAMVKPSGTKHGNSAPVHAAVAAMSAHHAAPKHSAKGAVSARATAQVGSHLTTATHQAGFGSLVATAAPGGFSRPWLTIDLIAHPAPFVPTAHGDSGVVIHTAAPATAPPAQPTQSSSSGVAVAGTGAGNIRPLTLPQTQPASPHAGGIRAFDTLSGGSGGSGGSTPHPVTLTLSGGALQPVSGGGYNGVIGGNVTATLVATDGEPIKSIEWIVPLGIASDTHQFRYENSTATPVESPVVTTTTNSFSFFWDANADGDNTAHSVSAFATFADNSQNGTAVSVNVEKPTGSFTDTFTANNFANWGNGVIGYQDRGLDRTTPGNTFQASATTAQDFGGYFGFLTLVNANDAIYLHQTDPVFVNTSGYVLDNYQETGDPLQDVFVKGRTSVNQPANSPISYPPANAVYSITDSPQFITPAQLYPASNYAWKLEENNSLTTYLMYSSQNGAWVSIASYDWSASGTSQFSDPDPPSDQAFYADTAHNWSTVIAASPAAANGGISTPNYKYVTWTDYYSDFAPPG